MSCIMVRLTPATLDVLKTIAHFNGEPMSTLSRRFIEQGVTRACNTIGDDALTDASQARQMRERRINENNRRLARRILARG